MPSNEKQIAIHTFSEGLDTTSARELSKNTTYSYALNINTMSTANGDVGIVTNIKGNVIIPKALPSGRCRTVGWARDEEVNKLYEFVWNENLYHTIYQYDAVTNQSIIVLQNLTDTGGTDIFKWTENDLILMTDVVRNSLLYWVKKGNKASKFNINKALDKSSSGYGIVTEEFINAYKLAPIAAPVMEYYSDTTVPINRLYGTLIKTAVRHIFDDFEQSNYSDYSNAVVPSKEAFSGVNIIPTDNNAIKITVPTGSAIVKKIEIVFQYTLDGGFSQWRRIVVLDKEELSIGDNTTYTYTFYNSDGEYPVVDQEKVIRPYSYLPNKPLCQAFTQNSMVYANFDAGFEKVKIDMSFEAPIYEDLFIPDSTVPVMNTPQILIETVDVDYMGSLYIDALRVDGTRFVPRKITRAVKFKLTIGDDVKVGNQFNLSFNNGYSPDAINILYKAINTDTAQSVANKIKQQIINTGRALKHTEDLDADIYNNTNSGGNYSFEFILYSSPKEQYLQGSSSVNPVSTSTLKDTGVSVSNQKMGDSVKYAIMYEDDDGRRSLSYTNTGLIVKIDSQNVQGGLKKVTLILNINHTPPIWAKKYQIVRTDSLVYDFNSLIQMVVQKVVDVPLTDQVTGDYVDLLVGSLYTYQKIHPNTTLKYEFKKGDRIRFISKEDGSYYPFFETEVLSYSDTVTSVIEQNVVIDGNDTVTVGETNVDNIGNFIIIDGSERLIIDVINSTEYQVNFPIGKTGESATFLEYTIVNRRGSIRIRKPSVTLEDLSLIELFAPNVSSDNDKQFYHFNKKFDIIDYGLPTRQHFGDIQQQTNSQPAKISITEGTIYVRSREMPITNELPAQVVIRTIEDPSYSDFYFSFINSNGKPNAEDNGSGVVHFGTRFVFSNNYVEDTKINGLNDFDNLDRRDYYDKYGDVMLIVFTESKLLVFKQQKDCFIYVNQTIIRDNADTELLGTSSRLLNELGYYTHQGGIGNNPESYFSYGNRHYHASVNSGVFCRLSTDGVTPISEIFQFDNRASEILQSAGNNGAFIYGGFDVENNVAVWAIPTHEDYTFNSDFTEAQWKILDDERPDGTPIEILTQPVHGVATLNGEFADVTNDGTVSSDSFTYRVFVDGEWINRKVCITYNEPANRQTGWRAKTYSCILESGAQTGFKEAVILEEYYLDDNTVTGNEKTNIPTDPNYEAPIYDAVACVPDEPIDTFTLQILIKDTYQNGFYNAEDTRLCAIRFTFEDFSTYEFTIASDIVRDNIVHSFEVPLSVLNGKVTVFNSLLTTGAGITAGDDIVTRVFVNDVFKAENIHNRMPDPPIAVGYQYQTPVTISGGVTINSGDVVMVVSEAFEEYTLLTPSFGIAGSNSINSCYGDTDTENLYTLNETEPSISSKLYKSDGVGGYEPFNLTPLGGSNDPFYYWLSYEDGADRKWLRMTYDGTGLAGDTVSVKGACPDGSDITLEVLMTADGGTMEIGYDAVLSGVLTNNLSVNATFNYSDGSGEHLNVPFSFTMLAGTTSKIGTVVSYTDTLLIYNVYSNVTSVAPNPNGGLDIIY